MNAVMEDSRMINVSASELKSCKGRLIDVRTPREFAGERLPDAENVPLDRIVGEAGRWDRSESLILVCAHGVRSQDAAKRLEQLGFSRVHSLEGGLHACKRAGLEVITDRKPIPLVRQALIVAGSMVLLGLLLARFVSPWFLLLDLMLGCGMVFAGTTGLCPMAWLVSKMPWNGPVACPLRSWVQGS
jgi:rhodanese-related sulfurtransferase